ncbi:MAG: sigma 54-interacting transcriptional regulator [Candidatus Binatia bacterium]
MSMWVFPSFLSAVASLLLAATNSELQLAMKEGRFREDLDYRLNTVTITVPPLHERGADIVMLSKSLLQRYAEEAKRPFPPPLPFPPPEPDFELLEKPA